MAAELYDVDVRDLLFAARPAPEFPADWVDVVGRSEVSRPELRRWVVVAVVGLAVLLVVVGASLAAVGDLPWLGNPRSIRVETTNAEKVVEFRLHTAFGIYPAGTTVAVWRAPASDGLVCTYVEEVPQPVERAGKVGRGGGQCTHGPPRAIPDPDSLLTSYSVAWGDGGVFTGGVSPLAGVARVALRSEGGEEPVAYANGSFIGQVPAADMDGGEVTRGGPFWIVGYDGAGNVLGSVRLGGPAGP